MTVPVSSILTRAKRTLQDTTGIRWPDLELLDWLNDGQREVAMLVPQAGAVTTTVALVNNSRQQIPSDGTQFLKLVRNIGGRAIRQTQQSILDSQIPNWHEAVGNEVMHYTFDPIEPRSYYVYPRASRQVELVYARSPSASTMNGNLSIPAIYANAVLDYILYRAYSKDAEQTANRELANIHYTRFVESLGMKAQVDAMAAAQQSSVTRPVVGS